MVKQLWNNLVQGLNTERPVQGRSDGRTRKVWISELGSYSIFVLALVTINSGDLNALTGGDAAKVLLLFFGTMVGSYTTGAFGLSNLIERLVTRKKTKDEPASE